VQQGPSSAVPGSQEAPIGCHVAGVHQGEEQDEVLRGTRVVVHHQGPDPAGIGRGAIGPLERPPLCS